MLLCRLLLCCCRCHALVCCQRNRRLWPSNHAPLLPEATPRKQAAHGAVGRHCDGQQGSCSRQHVGKGFSLGLAATGGEERRGRHVYALCRQLMLEGCHANEAFGVNHPGMHYPSPQVSPAAAPQGRCLAAPRLCERQTATARLLAPGSTAPRPAGCPRRSYRLPAGGCLHGLEWLVAAVNRRAGMPGKCLSRRQQRAAAAAAGGSPGLPGWASRLATRCGRSSVPPYTFRQMCARRALSKAWL